jgi:hypothetical protein
VHHSQAAAAFLQKLLLLARVIFAATQMMPATLQLTFTGGLASLPSAAAMMRLVSSVSGISNVAAQCFNTASMSCNHQEESPAAEGKQTQHM